MCKSAPKTPASRAESDANGHDADMLDARIGQEPFEVPLNQDERHRDEHREQAQRQQQAPRERRPRAAFEIRWMRRMQ